MIARILMALTMALSAWSGPGAGDLHEEGLAMGDHYVFFDEKGIPSVWVETNGFPGLQTRPHRLPDGEIVWADARGLV